MKKLNVIAVVVLFLISLNCKKTNTSNHPLSPARNISGTWTTPFPVTFFMMSDGCGAGFIRYNSTPITMTWTITTIDDNNVDIWISSNTIGTTTQLASNCGLGATLVFPLHFHGNISSSNIQLTEKQLQYNNSGGATGFADVTTGNFNFTNNSINGTITEKDCPIYCGGFSTDNNKCFLTR